MFSIDQERLRAICREAQRARDAFEARSDEFREARKEMNTLRNWQESPSREFEMKRFEPVFAEARAAHDEAADASMSAMMLANECKRHAAQKGQLPRDLAEPARSVAGG